jgi:glucose/arabinose dehydrogenase
LKDLKAILLFFKGASIKYFLVILSFFVNLIFANYQFETIASNLDDAWSFDFLNENQIIFTEQPGKIKIVTISSGEILNVEGAPKVQYASQGGLSEILLDPDFKKNNTLYLTYSALNESGKSTLFLMSAELSNNSLINKKVIFEANAFRRVPIHLGAKIDFLSDGTLLLTSGDGFDYKEQAQSLNNHFGKIIRIKKDGSVPSDNPFVDIPNALPEIFSYGHRNMQGLVVMEDGRIFEHEHGPRGGDEFNLIEPGKNYGWPAITYGIDYSGAVISPFTEMDGMEQPLKYWVPSIAPSDMIYYDGDLYPELKNSLLITALKSRDVKKIKKTNGLFSEESIFSNLKSRLRSIRVSPSGEIYLLTDGRKGKLIKVSITEI